MNTVKARPKELPIRIMWDGTVPRELIDSAEAGIKELLKYAGMTNQIGIEEFGPWRSEYWSDGRNLRPYHSIDWYTDQGNCNRCNQWGADQLDAGEILAALCEEPWQTLDPHYDILITDRDLTGKDSDGSWYNFVIGSAQPEYGAVISTYRFRRLQGLDLEEQCELFRTAVVHELCHVFGLPCEERTDLVQSLGGHCPNRCVMRQGLRVEEWIQFTIDRAERGALCFQCQHDLWEYFHRPNGVIGKILRGIQKGFR